MLAGLIVLGLLGLIRIAGGVIALPVAFVGLGGRVVATSDAYRARAQSAAQPETPKAVREMAPAAI